MKSLEQLDSWIGNKVKAWSSKVSRASHRPELLEIRREMLADVRDKIQPKGQGKNVFPYNVISVLIAAPDATQQTFLEAAFARDSELEQDIRALLTEASCPTPSGFAVTVSIVEDQDFASLARPFEIQYANTNRPVAPKPAEAGRPNARLTVIRGEADEREYAIASDRVNLGRMKEVVGDRDGLRRRNDIAFSEAESSVSREHAYIRYEPESGRFRLYDSMSQRGTSIFREGRRVAVPKGPTRGVQLRSGDEIHLGDARILFRIEP